jgi:hypothetical protein
VSFAEDYGARYSEDEVQKRENRDDHRL